MSDNDDAFVAANVLTGVSAGLFERLVLVWLRDGVFHVRLIHHRIFPPRRLPTRIILSWITLARVSRTGRVALTWIALPRIILARIHLIAAWVVTHRRILSVECKRRRESAQRSNRFKDHLFRNEPDALILPRQTIILEAFAARTGS
jgi:hypothetical protein